jgi:hypothetical protein
MPKMVIMAPKMANNALSSCPLKPDPMTDLPSSLSFPTNSALIMALWCYKKGTLGPSATLSPNKTHIITETQDIHDSLERTSRLGTWVPFRSS